MNDAPAIELRDLGKRFGDRDAVAGLTMRVARGEVFGFLGPNGAGKTTVVKMLVGLVHRTSGDAALLGKPLGAREVRGRIGYLPELFRYQDWLTPAEVLGWHAAVLRLRGDERARGVEGGLRRVGLFERRNDLVGSFSKGMQQRLGLAVALLGAPELVFLDEPTSALDPIGRADVRGIVEELRDRGTTVFLNSHLLSEVESVCDRIAVIDGGRLIACGALRDVLGMATLRVRFEAIGAELRALLAARGASVNGTTAEFSGLTQAGIPDIVRELVQAGARIVAVEPARATLEERFLEMLDR